MAHIQIPDTTPRVQYSVGATPDSDFTIPFAYFADADIVVYVDDTLQTITTDYTVSGTAVDEGYSGGTVNMVSAVTNAVVTIYRDVSVARSTDFPTNGQFDITQLNTELDKMTMMIQQNEHNLGFALHTDQFDETANLTLPNKATRANSYLKFDTNGAPVTVADEDLVTDLAGVVIRANYITDNATGDGTTVNFTLSSDPSAKSNLQIYIDGVYQNKATFSLSGTTVIFTEAPPLNASVEFIIGYSIGSRSDAAMYSDTTANFTGTLQNDGSNVVVDSDIGSTVQGYDANILTSSDIGSTVQAYDATILKSADIGSTIQAYDANTAKTDVAQTFTGEQTFNENIVFGTSGKGIDFSATSGTGTSELLDDYEEGTWTPALAAGTLNGTSITYTGKYTKVGNLVTVYFHAQSTTDNLQAVGYASFSGLPFAAASTTSGTSSVITEDIDVFSRQGFASAGTNLTLSACGSSSGTTNLRTTITYFTS